MNQLCFIVTSTLEKIELITRFFDSLGSSNQITVIFINQSTEEETFLLKKYEANFHLIEIKSGCHIPLSTARNLALNYLYNNPIISDDTLVLFTDDDAWFPENTINYLLNCEIKAFTLKVLDPVLNKSFIKYQKKRNGIVKEKEIITDIVSFSIIVPFKYFKNDYLKFNEKLGLGTNISQGEETFFCYQLYKLGYHFSRLDYYVYHPYKKTFNEHNFYSLAYFLSSFTRYVSPIFISYMLFFMAKYSVAALLGFFKDKRYFCVTKNVYKGFFDGINDIYSIFRK
jgi:hypothetical protein